MAWQSVALTQWQAGQVVDSAAVSAYGEERCFVAEEIGDSLWQRMQGKTYKENPHIGRNDLRHVRVLHWDLDGRIRMGEMVCNQLIAEHLVDIFHELYRARYPIERMVLPDEYDADDERQMQANNTSCFCYRTVAGSNSLSNHARGLAVDLNPLYNPYVRQRRDGSIHVQPITGKPYCDRSRKFPYKIDRQDLAYRLFTEHGFTWGGNWHTHKDYQHFEMRSAK